MTGREGLAAAGGHLDHGPGAIVGQGLVEVADGFDLHIPKAIGDEFRHVPQIGPELAVERCQSDQFFGPMEGEDFPAAGIGVETVGETGFGAGGLVGERQRQMVMRQSVGQARRVLGRLQLDAGERVVFGLGFDDADGLGIGVEQVVGKRRSSAGTPGSPPPGPPRCSSADKVWTSQPHCVKLLVDLLAGLLFGSHQVISRYLNPAFMTVTRCVPTNSRHQPLSDKPTPRCEKPRFYRSVGVAAITPPDRDEHRENSQDLPVGQSTTPTSQPMSNLPLERRKCPPKPPGSTVAMTVT